MFLYEPNRSAEWELRVQLAGAYRIIDFLGWSELIWTHTTVRVPGPEHHFLINPYGLRFDEVRASNLVKMDMHGNIIGDIGDQESRKSIRLASSSTAPFIWCGQMSAVLCIPTPSPAWPSRLLKTGLLPISMYALGYHERVAYHDFEGPSLDLDERERLAANLGDKNVLILRTHGLLTCGATIAQAFVRMYRLERACHVQLAAQSTGAALVIPPPEICRKSAELSDDFLATTGGKGYSRVPNPEFDALLRLMDKRDPSYRS